MTVNVEYINKLSGQEDVDFEYKVVDKSFGIELILGWYKRGKEEIPLSLHYLVADEDDYLTEIPLSFEEAREVFLQEVENNRVNAVKKLLEKGIDSTVADDVSVKIPYPKKNLDAVIELQESGFEYEDYRIAYWETDVFDDNIIVVFEEKSKPKRNYKQYTKEYLGYSDIASLTLRSPDKVSILNFGSDGDYHAYIVDENAKIGSHYTKVFECEHWLKIYYDDGILFDVMAKKFKIYRAGEFGCIIQVIGRREL